MSHRRPTHCADNTLQPTCAARSAAGWRDGWPWAWVSRYAPDGWLGGARPVSLLAAVPDSLCPRRGGGRGHRQSETTTRECPAGDDTAGTVGLRWSPRRTGVGSLRVGWRSVAPPPRPPGRLDPASVVACVPLSGHAQWFQIVAS